MDPAIQIGRNAKPMPPPLPGFEHVKRYWDKSMNCNAAKIMPGEFYVSNNGEMIVTVLGSCISACIRDVKLGLGGMNHFMLPTQGENMDIWAGSQVSNATRYGNWAMEYLINSILSLGGKRKNLEVKVFGGGQVLANMTDIGKRNYEFVHYFLVREGIQIKSEDVGDIYPRKVLYFPDTGAVKVRKLRQVANDTLAKRERSYIEEINQQPCEGEIDLF